MVDLESSIRNTNTRPHFHEAILAYQSGAYGAAIIKVWVAVALDLTDKIRLSADAGNTQAQNLIDGLDDAISKQDVPHLQTIETTLPGRAKAFGIITEREQVMLDRLKKDRNICAHPAFINEDEIFVPSEELARMHLTSAIDNCLALPSAPGKRVIEQYTECVDSFSWPRDSQELAVLLKSRFFNRVRYSTKKQLMELIIKQAIEPPHVNGLSNVASQTYAKRCRCSINAIYRFDDELVSGCMQNVLRKKRDSHRLDDDALLRFTGAFAHIHQFWISLEDDEVVRVKSLLANRRASMLDNSVDTIYTGVGSRSLGDLDVFASGIPRDERVAPEFVNAMSRLSKDPFGISDAIERATYGVESLIPIALQSLSVSSSFAASECVLRGLQNVTNELSRDAILELGRVSSENNQVFLARRVPTYFENLCRESSETPGKMSAWHTVATKLKDAYERGDSDEKESDNPFLRLLSITTTPDCVGVLSGADC